MNSEWLEVTDGGRTWELDSEFLSSAWTCIWDSGCAGIAERADVESGLGCCSVGAEMLDEDEAMRISALAATVDSALAQFADEIAADGALRPAQSERATWATRTVEGACIFLNRPGFEGGHGCALHLAAKSAGEAAIDWKPSICWQLPLKVEQVEPAEGETERLRLRRWLRSDWGPDGEQMAYCCTEKDAGAANAYVGDRPVVESLSEELAALLGPEVFDQLSGEL